MATRKNSNLTLRRASTASFRGPRGKVNDEEENKSGNVKTRQSKEFSEQGKVKWDVYKEYAKNSNLIAVTIYMVTLIGAKTAEIGKSPCHLAQNNLIVRASMGIGYARTIRFRSLRSAQRSRCANACLRRGFGMAQALVRGQRCFGRQSECHLLHSRILRLRDRLRGACCHANADSLDLLFD